MYSSKIFCLFYIIPCYFEHWVFLVLYVFSYYNKNRQRNQNKVINDKTIVFRFTSSSVLLVNNIIQVKQVISTTKKTNQSLQQNAKVCQSHSWDKTKVSAKFLAVFLAALLPRQTENFWNCHGNLLATYLTHEFRRLVFTV